jgi:phage-related protein
MRITPRKPVVFVGSSHKDLMIFPREVRRNIGFALDAAQRGTMADNAKPLHGKEFPGVSVVEIVEDFQTDAYRAVYTVRFAGTVYVLHCFQKKSKSGSETPKADRELILSRLKMAEARHAEDLQKIEKNREGER